MLSVLISPLRNIFIFHTFETFSIKIFPPSDIPSRQSLCGSRMTEAQKAGVLERQMELAEDDAIQRGHESGPRVTGTLGASALCKVLCSSASQTPRN